MPESALRPLSRLLYIKECYQHSKRNLAVAMAVTVFSIYSISMSALPLVESRRIVVFLAPWPKLPIPAALVIALAGILFIALEGGYRLRRAAIAEAEKVIAAKEKEIDRLIGSPDRPQIEVLRWTPIPSNHPEAIQHHKKNGFLQNGFQLKNHGGAAYDVVVEPFQLNAKIGGRSKPVASIGKELIGFALIWLDGLGYIAITQKWDLLLQLRNLSRLEHGESLYGRPNYTVPISVIYRSGNNQWYRTTQELRYVPSQDRIEFGAPNYESVHGGGLIQVGHE